MVVKFNGVSVDLENLSGHKTSFLVEMYNTHAERKVVKFRDRATAEKKVIELYSKHGWEEFVKKQPTVRGEGFKKWRAKHLSKDNKFFVVKDKNNRTKRNEGFPVWEIISANPGITLENLEDEFSMAHGGQYTIPVVKHIVWDLNKDNIRISD